MNVDLISNLLGKISGTILAKRSQICVRYSRVGDFTEIEPCIAASQVVGKERGGEWYSPRHLPAVHSNGTCTGTLYQITTRNTCGSIAKDDSMAMDGFTSANNLDCECGSLAIGSQVCCVHHESDTSYPYNTITMFLLGGDPRSNRSLYRFPFFFHILSILHLSFAETFLWPIYLAAQGWGIIGPLRLRSLRSTSRENLLC